MERLRRAPLSRMGAWIQGLCYVVDEESSISLRRIHRRGNVGKRLETKLVVGRGLKDWTTPKPAIKQASSSHRWRVPLWGCLRLPTILLI